MFLAISVAFWFGIVSPPCSRSWPAQDDDHSLINTVAFWLAPPARKQLSPSDNNRSLWGSAPTAGEGHAPWIVPRSVERTLLLDSGGLMLQRCPRIMTHF